MNPKNRYWYFLFFALLGPFLLSSRSTAAQQNSRVYIPLLIGAPKPLTEVRGLWVTRFDWTEYGGADPERIDEVVDNAAAAGFNVLFFQVRGEADAYYTPGLEPWARRLTGQFGQDPGWDPLARLVQHAHEHGLQVHAYLNVYPVWADCQEPPPADTVPRHLYYRLLEAHGETNGRLNGLMWAKDGTVSCSGYQRASPASIAFDDHFLAVAKDIVQRYDIDGLHLDHIRYAGRETSCDPVSENRFGAPCFTDEGYADWQREQIDGTVHKVYEAVQLLQPDLWLTAAVFPVHRDKWGWGASSAFDDYYQDSKGWLAAGAVDGITPMIYTGSPNCDAPYFWTQERWQTLVEDYLQDSDGRMIIPGIGTRFCSDDDFAEIEARILYARALGAAGHALYSYRSLEEQGYFDDLAAGPYRLPAILPDLAWR